MQAVEGRYAVRALGDVQTLGSIPFVQARPAISAALAAFERRASFESWTIRRQTLQLQSAVCKRDDLPATGTVRLSSYLPFLSV